jgi:uncharacterized membrane protein
VGQVKREKRSLIDDIYAVINAIPGTPLYLLFGVLVVLLIMVSGLAALANSLLFGLVAGAVLALLYWYEHR